MSTNKKTVARASVLTAPTAEELLRCVDATMAQAGKPILTLALLPVMQDEVPLYMTKMSVAATVALICRYPYEIPAEVQDSAQQGLSLSKVYSLRFRHGDTSVFPISPSNIIVDFKEDAVDGNVVTRKFGHIRGIKYTALEIDLDAYRARIVAAEKDENGRLLYPEAVMLGFLVEGHHRVEASYEANKLDYEYPTSMFFEAGPVPVHLSDVFETVNNKRSSPSSIMTLAMRKLSNMESREEEVAEEILRYLMQNSKSIFNGRIRLRGRMARDEGESLRKYATNDKVLEWVRKLMTEWECRMKRYPGVAKLSPKEKFEIINAYFIAVSKVFPRAWDSEEYVLTKSMGIDIMMRSMVDIMVLHYALPGSDYDKAPKVKDFERALRRAFFSGSRVKSLTLCDRVHPLNWTCRGFGALSGGKGTDQIKSELRSMIEQELLEFGEEM